MLHQDAAYTLACDAADVGALTAVRGQFARDGAGVTIGFSSEAQELATFEVRYIHGAHHVHQGKGKWS